MLVKDVVQYIESKSISIKELSQKHNVSDRTIQNKIKGLGFKWLPKERKYEYVGSDDIEKAYAIEWESLFDSTSQASIKKKHSNSMAKSEVQAGQKEIASTTQVKEKQDASTIDSIDKLLAGKNKNEGRKYRGFYFDSDVLSIIDGVDSGTKSELVNQCLRKIFKDKGLL